MNQRHVTLWRTFWHTLYIVRRTGSILYTVIKNINKSKFLFLRIKRGRSKLYDNRISQRLGQRYNIQCRVVVIHHHLPKMICHRHVLHNQCINVVHHLLFVLYQHRKHNFIDHRFPAWMILFRNPIAKGKKKTIQTERAL